MRPALILACTALLAACDAQPAPAPAEQRSASGEVLGGEASDAMLPLDTVRSTSPAGASTPDGEDAAKERSGSTKTERSSGTPTPRRTFEAAPLPDMTMPADPEPLRTDDE